MAHKRKSAHRAKPASRPRGIFEATSRGFGFVRTPEGEFFIAAHDVRGAMDGDEVELSVKPEKNISRAKRSKRSYKGSKPGKNESGNQDSPDSKRPCARVARVLTRAHDDIVGRYEEPGPFGVVIPLDPAIRFDIFIPLDEKHEAHEGDLVRVMLTSYPQPKSPATGVVTEVLGKVDPESLPIEAIIAALHLPSEFPPEVQREAHELTLCVDEALASGAEDIRDRFIFTIDPADAKDFDDALSVDVYSGMPWDLEDAYVLGSEYDARHAQWKIGVSIADVSSYVKEATALDTEARTRATSVYLADRVIPMLPERLCNDLCSLAPGVDRLALTVDLYVDTTGQCLAFRVYPSVIRSKARLTYSEAFALLQTCANAEADLLKDSEGEAGAEALESLAGAARVPQEMSGCVQDACVQKALADRAQRQFGFDTALLPVLLPALKALDMFACARKRRRHKLGGLPFDTSEARVVLDVNKVPLYVEVREKNAATELVEEAMIAANEAIATFTEAFEVPSLYRNHAAPDPGRLQELVDIFNEFSWFAYLDKEGFCAGNPHVLQQVIEVAEGRSEQELVNTLLLRAMKRAEYSPEDEGHYGLASGAYTHFTSPIRRYPDVVVHRIVKDCLAFGPKKIRKVAQAKTSTSSSYQSLQTIHALPDIANHASHRERVAEDAERQSQEAKIIEWLSQFIGERFSGVVSGVTQKGLFVRLDCSAEGFLPIQNLGREYFIYDGKHHMLLGEATGARYRLGQRVAVVLDEAEPMRRRLRFSLAQETKKKPRGTRKNRKG